MSLRILMVLDHTFPPDPRVENEALSLIDAGHQVTVLAVAPDDRPDREVRHGIRVIREKLPGRVRNAMRGLAGTLPILTWYLSRRIERHFGEGAFDVIHVHDLYLFGGGLRAAARLDAPIVGDLHENWIAALQHYAWSTRFPGRLVISIRRWKHLERKWVNAVDRLIVVVEEAAARNRALGVPDEKIAIVPNTIRLSEFEAYDIDEQLVERIRSPFTLLYTGGFDTHRGLHSLIEAMPLIRARVSGAKLVLVGDGRIRSELRKAVTNLDLDEAVQFEGWKPQHLIKSYIAGCDVGLVPHLRTVHTDATLPHKLFHYMYAGKPVVVSNCRPLERIVSEVQAGLVYEAGNPEALAAAAVSLATDRAKAAEAGRRAREAVLDKYNWDTTAAALVRVYDELDRQY